MAMVWPSSFIFFLIIFSLPYSVNSSHGQPHFFPSKKASLLHASHHHNLTISSYSYDTLFYTQTLDHFSFTPSSYRTFQQRYLVNTQHWGGAKHRAPIFLYCGNEGNIEWFANNTGFLWEIAPLYSAMVVFLEHRYYGQSIPDIAQTTRSADTLGYLTSEQALADYAVLIQHLKQKYSAQDSPVVLFGGSYGGMLAAWFRLKYPHIAIGALAASAPILQFDELVPLDGFYRIVSEDFKNASTSCFETIKSSWDALSAAYDKSGGMEKVSKLFGFCSNVSADLSSVQGFLSTAWVYMAMTDYPYPANFLEPMPANPVKVVMPFELVKSPGRKFGKARSIGVSNYGVHHLQELFSNCEIRPSINQVELHPFNGRKELVEFCHKENIVVEAYSPLTQGQRLNDPTLVQVLLEDLLIKCGGQARRSCSGC